MLDTGVDAARGTQGFPHGFGGADDGVFMPLQCSTQWDGLGHISDTWGFEVRPNEFGHAFQPLHQVVIPHIGLSVGELWDL